MISGRIPRPDARDSIPALGTRPPTTHLLCPGQVEVRTQDNRAWALAALSIFKSFKKNGIKCLIMQSFHGGQAQPRRAAEKKVSFADPARSAHAPPDARPAPGPDPGEGHAAAAAAAGDPSVAAGAIGDPNTAPGDAGALTAGDPGHAAAAAAAALRDEAAAAAAFRDARVRVRVLDDGTPSSDAPMPSPPQASRTHGGRRVRPSPPRAPAQPPLPPVPVTLPSPRQDARPRALPLVTPLDRAWTPARRVVCVVP